MCACPFWDAPFRVLLEIIWTCCCGHLLRVFWQQIPPYPQFPWSTSYKALWMLLVFLYSTRIRVGVVLSRPRCSPEGPVRVFFPLGLLIIGGLPLLQRQSSSIVRWSLTRASSESLWRTTQRGWTMARRERGNRTGRVSHLIGGDSFFEAWTKVHYWATCVNL